MDKIKVSKKVSILVTDKVNSSEDSFPETDERATRISSESESRYNDLENSQLLLGDKTRKSRRVSILPTEKVSQ